MLVTQSMCGSCFFSTARNAGSGRSFTYHAVHCSEVAFWEDPDDLMLGLHQSIPNKHGTLIVYESTANGVGNWFPLRVNAPAEIIHITLRQVEVNARTRNRFSALLPKTVR